MVLNKKIVILISLFSLLICILTLQDTYAKYTSQATGTTDISIARWRILVNDFDIRQSITSNSLITPVFEGTSHIASNIIAPTSRGYFDVIIDGNDTDVSFNYTINIDVDKSSSVTDLLVTGYELDDGELVNIDNGEDITGTVYFSDTNKVKKIRVYVMWNDETGTMDNAADTNATANNTNAKINVNVNFTQKV